MIKVNDILAFGILGIAVYTLLTIVSVQNTWVNTIGIIGSLVAIISEAMYLIQLWSKKR